MFSWVHWDSIDELFSTYRFNTLFKGYPMRKSEYDCRDMCEGGWDVKVIVLTAALWSPRTMTWAQRNLKCFRNEVGIVLEVD